MFTNREHCTVWEKTIRDRAPAYVRHEIGAHYQEMTQAQEQRVTQGNTSRLPANSTLFIIPAASLTYLPKSDDRIVSGICTDNAPPGSALTVTAVKDFRYGSEMVQHVEVTAQ